MAEKNRSRTYLYLACAVLFLGMLVCNLLTDLCVDDFLYYHSFADGSRITSVFAIFPSMLAHAKSMNGRLVAHFFVQLSLLLPMPVFKIVNSALFVLQVWLICRIAAGGKNVNALLLCTAAGLIWIFEPAFGEVNLWLDGSCNYLWCAVAELAFFLPYADEFLTGRQMKSTALKILFIVFGLLAGWYGENASAAAIFVVFVFLCLIRFYRHQRPGFEKIGAFVAALAGYALMMSSPAEWKNKASAMSLGAYRRNFISALEMLREFWPLIALFVILFVLACTAKTKKEIRIVAGVMAAGAFFANFMMVAASYYPERSAFFPCVLLVLADMILLTDLSRTKYKACVACCIAVTLLLTAYWGCIGLNDIYTTHLSVRANESAILDSKARGTADVSVPMVYPQTKYSAVYGLKYLDTQDASSWPNSSIAAYYGVRSVIGLE